jgi:putative heme-binding domain-containing protein
MSGFVAATAFRRGGDSVGLRCCALAFLSLVALVSPSAAQTLDEDLRQAPATELAAMARNEGDAARGAVVFFQPQMACSKCHATGKTNLTLLGPDLTAVGKNVSDESLVESVLLPSKVIRKEFESVNVATFDGNVLSAMVVERTKDKLVVRDILSGGKLTTILASDIEEITVNQGIDPASSSLEIGIFGAEPWTNAMRAEIEQAFDMDATDIYGLSEVIGPGVAQECVETKDGLHVWEDHFYPEVTDPETGMVLPDGEKGELVFTSLTKEAFPIIRYRTRDLTRLLPGTARPGMRRMEKVTGRSDDMIILRGVNVFPTQIEEALLATNWCGGHFIIELTREGRMDEMTVLAEARPEHWDGNGLTDQADKVATFIKNTIGITARIKVVAPEALERSLGKAMRVFDKRPKG